MATFYKRSIRRRFWNWCDDCSWTWNRHKDGFIRGFVFGVLCVVLMFELVWSI